METTVIRRMGIISGAFVFIMSMLFSIYGSNVYAQPEEYINSGEQLLYTGVIEDILAAHAIFEDAASPSNYPDDPVINAYLALTRLLSSVARSACSRSCSAWAR